LSEANKNWLYSQAGDHTASVQKAAGLGANSTLQEVHAAVDAWKKGSLQGVAPTLSGQPSIPVGQHGAFGKAPLNFPEGQLGRTKLPVAGGLATGALAMAAAPEIIELLQKNKMPEALGNAVKTAIDLAPSMAVQRVNLLAQLLGYHKEAGKGSTLPENDRSARYENNLLDQVPGSREKLKSMLENQPNHESFNKERDAYIKALPKVINSIKRQKNPLLYG